MIDELLDRVDPLVIEERFVQLRESPIELLGMVIDCDENSINTMRQTLKFFDDQPLLHNVFEDDGGQKKVKWRLADSSEILLGKDQLQVLVTELEKAKALRTAKLYARKRWLNENGRLFSDYSESWY